MQTHHRKTLRAQRYDYTSPGAYFVTICTKDRVHYFGEIVNGKMVMNELGKICIQEIIETQQRRSHLRIDEYIVMPNHIHMMIIVRTYGNTSGIGSDNISNINIPMDALPRVPTESLGSIVRNIKSRVTKYANQNNIPFARQGRYHDHIICNTGEYERIKYYIQTNPENRKKDCFS